MKNLNAHYSILGGVVAPKNSAYMIQGMKNPLAEKPTKAIDTSLPSLRNTGAVARFNDFNPYNNALLFFGRYSVIKVNYRSTTKTVVYFVD